MTGVLQIQSCPTPNIWEGVAGIRDEDGKIIRDEAGRYLREDHDGRPTTPPATDYFAWFKADALPQINDSAVATWTDSGTRANNLTSSDPTKTHLFLNSVPDSVGAGGIGPVVRWSNTATMDTPHPISTVGKTGCSWLIVARRTGFTGNRNLFTLLTSFSTSDGCLFQPIGTTAIALNIPGVSPDLTITLGDWHVISLTYDQSEDVQRVQTNLESSSGPHAGGGAGLIPLDYLAFQQDQGEVKEALFYMRKLTDAELYGTRSYLARKYSIQIA